MKKLAIAIALLALALAPVASAAARLEISGAGSSWNGAYESDGPDLWAPPGARIHAVQALPGNATISQWSVGADGELHAALPPNATGARVSFDFEANPVRLARFVAPAAIDALTIRLDAPDGMVARADETDFAGDTAVARDLAPGQGITLRVVDADRVGELGIVVTVAALAAVMLLLTLLYHKIHPPLEGKRPEKFLEHLSELQARLMPPAILFGVLNVYYFTSGLRRVTLGGFPLVAPTFSVDGSLATRAFEAFTERLVPAGVQLVVTRPADAVVAQVQMAFFLSFVTILPLLLYEIAVFVGPALGARERRLALRAIPLVVGLFLLGAAFGYLFMAPFMLRTLYAFAPSLGATSLLGIGDLVGFVVIVLLSFGAAFELPIVMHALTRFGVVSAATWRKYVRHAIVIIVLVAGIITPDPSVVSQIIVSVPLLALYMLGMLAATVAERRGAARAAAAAA